MGFFAQFMSYSTFA